MKNKPLAEVDLCPDTTKHLWCQFYVTTEEKQLRNYLMIKFESSSKMQGADEVPSELLV